MANFRIILFPGLTVAFLLFVHRSEIFPCVLYTIIPWSISRVINFLLFCHYYFHLLFPYHYVSWRVYSDIPQFSFVMEEYKSIEKKVKHILNIYLNQEYQGFRRSALNCFPSRYICIKTVYKGQQEYLQKKQFIFVRYEPYPFLVLYYCSVSTAITIQRRFQADSNICCRAVFVCHRHLIKLEIMYKYWRWRQLRLPF